MAITYSTEDVSSAENGWMFSLAGKKLIQRSERWETPNEDLITETSVKYSVLSKNTAMFGKMKNKTKSKEEVKTIEMPLTNYRDTNSHQPMMMMK